MPNVQFTCSFSLSHLPNGYLTYGKYTDLIVEIDLVSHNPHESMLQGRLRHFILHVNAASFIPIIPPRPCTLYLIRQTAMIKLFMQW